MALKIKIKKESKVRNPIAVALAARHGGKSTKMKDRRDRRLKDARRQREEW